MKKLFYLFTFILAVTFAACDNGQPDWPSGDSNVPENPSNPNEPSNPNQPSEPSKPEDPANGHEFVDLGLSVKWATCNVGANNPEEYGDYFAWGETKPKDNYSWSTYKWYYIDSYLGYEILTKYCAVDNKTVLVLEDDAARVNWGGEWRMPTMTEQKELIDNCTWTRSVKNGVNGYNVTSNWNGNSIFLPTAGYYSGFDLYDAGSYGYYWGSSLNSSYLDNACSLDFGSDDEYRDSYSVRNGGLSVRPVLP